MDDLSIPDEDYWTALEMSGREFAHGKKKLFELVSSVIYRFQGFRAHHYGREEAG